MPPAVLRAIGVFNPTMREIVEMQYQFEEPFIVESSPITQLLGLTATPLSRALAITRAAYEHTDQAAATSGSRDWH
ncbi:hypothetical protein ACPW96_22805 [Micromonospora sp. DT81.3]|uniref:hypothetical protein n=1 Tax=Micromonospora sp. DT81.3 TaxID=3416523 RepID=UPI003CE86D18